MVAARRRGHYEALAKKRMAAGGRKAAPGKPAKKKGVETVPQVIGQKSRDEAGAAVGVSGKMVDKAMELYAERAKKRQLAGNQCGGKTAGRGRSKSNNSSRASGPTSCSSHRARDEAGRHSCPVTSAHRARNFSRGQLKVVLGRVYNREKMMRGGQCGNANARKRTDQSDPFVSEPKTPVPQRMGQPILPRSRR